MEIRRLPPRSPRRPRLSQVVTTFTFWLIAATFVILSIENEKARLEENCSFKKTALMDATVRRLTLDVVAAALRFSPSPTPP